MENTRRPSGISGLSTSADGNVERLSFGAIESPMAVSFREEKLALRAAQNDFSPSAETPMTRFADADRVA